MDGSTASSTLGYRRARKRAALACQLCHERKVRCNVTQSGPPCVNCLGDGMKCEIVPRGRARGRHHLVRILGEQQRGRTPSPPPPLPPPPQPRTPSNNICTSSVDVEAVSNTMGRSNSYSTTLRLWTPESVPSCDREPRREGQQHQPTASNQPGGPGESNRQEEDKDAEGEHGGFSEILGDQVANEETVCIYTGDPQGLGLVVDICKPDRHVHGNHFMIPRAATKNTLSPEDLAALHAKGCFTLPTEHVRKQLLRCYFHHIHPFLPILEANTFIHQYGTGGPKQTNLLLLWSMFFASSSFLDDQTVTVAGYSSRKAMKKSIFQRAKALYNADYEKEKIPLIQSVLLLAYWYADSEDRDGSWHWIGIAISLCQTMGLHRNPIQQTPFKKSLMFRDQATTERTFRLWRLIWWACYFRDTWLSFGMGRPTRISLSDCDMPLPTEADFNALICDISPEHANTYMPKDEQHCLPTLWSSLLETTFVLGSILKHHYRPWKPDNRPQDLIDQDRRKLLRCRATFPSEDLCESPIVLSHFYHLCVYYEACNIALHRPYMAGRPGLSSSTEDESWELLALQRSKIATSNIDGVLNKMTASRMIQTCQPMMVTAMIPALQIHLFESTSDDPIARTLGQNHLDISMILLSELRSMYWAADFIHSLFLRAINELKARGVREGNLGIAASVAHRSRDSILNETTSGNAPHESRAPVTPQSHTTDLPNIIDHITNTKGCRQEQSPDLQVNSDIDFAFACDLPFQFDLGCDYSSFGAFDPSLELFAGQCKTPRNLYLSDADLNLLFGVTDEQQEAG